jgi:hypothetical protein
MPDGNPNPAADLAQSVRQAADPSGVIQVWLLMAVIVGAVLLAGELGGRRRY